ncbi:hypothetical protein HOLleu_33041 [Holothuria leucospilota]|uniref:Uncharacterized protein n=1 Tax=Holothuria leucospilota TaxID=206669 RepID=A0A9Q1BH06_HOLLE|nr:hypothetical protein HOLleu_33041 [Holothuria leucospilota]
MYFPVSSSLCLLHCLILSSFQVTQTAARYYYPVTNIMYGARDPTITRLQRNGFGFYNHGFLSFELICPTPEKGGLDASPAIILLPCVPNEDRDSSQQTVNMDAAHKDQTCKIFENSHDPFERSYGFCGGYNLKCTRRFDGQCVGWQMAEIIPQEQEDYYEFFILQCPQKSTNRNVTVPFYRAECQGNLTLLNNFGYSHLGRGEEPLPYIFKVLLCLWTVLLVYWISNWVKYREYSNRLHKLMIVSPAFKYVVIILSIFFWEIIARTGNEHATLNSVILILTSAEDATLFMTLMLAAEGWCVMRPQIRKVKHALIPVLFLAFLASVICVIWIHSYFMAFAVCSIVFVIYRALKWCSFNLDVLNKQLLAVHQMVIQKEVKFKDLGFEDQLVEKRDIYIKLRMVIAMYTMVFAIITTMSTFLSEYMYVKTLSFEIPELLVYASIGYIFKLGDFSRFENIEVVIPQENSVVIFLPYPNENWPKRQKLVLGMPLEDVSVEVVDEEKAPLKENEHG